MSKLATMFVTAMCFTSLTDLAAAKDPPSAPINVTVRVVALKVVDEQFDDDAFESSPFHHLGTTLHLLLTTGEKNLVGFDEETSKVTSFVDDRGTDMLKEKPKPKKSGFHFGGSRSPIGSWPKFSKDKKALVIDISGPRSPAAGAGHLTLQGMIAVTVASGQRKQRLENIEFKPAKLDVKGYSVEIEKAGMVKGMISTEEEFNITLKFDDATDKAVESVKFFESDGTEIEVSSWWSSGSSKRFTLDKKVASGTIELVFWQGLQTVPVPVNVKQSLGFAAGGS